jgi:hypothetical protein
MIMMQINEQSLCYDLMFRKERVLTLHVRFHNIRVK